MVLLTCIEASSSCDAKIKSILMRKYLCIILPHEVQCPTSRVSRVIFSEQLYFSSRFHSFHAPLCTFKRILDTIMAPYPHIHLIIQ